MEALVAKKIKLHRIFLTAVLVSWQTISPTNGGDLWYSAEVDRQYVKSSTENKLKEGERKKKIRKAKSAEYEVTMQHSSASDDICLLGSVCGWLSVRVTMPWALPSFILRNSKTCKIKSRFSSPPLSYVIYLEHICISLIFRRRSDQVNVMKRKNKHTKIAR